MAYNRCESPSFDDCNTNGWHYCPVFVEPAGYTGTQTIVEYIKWVPEVEIDFDRDAKNDAFQIFIFSRVAIKNVGPRRIERIVVARWVLCFSSSRAGERTPLDGLSSGYRSFYFLSYLFTVVWILYYIIIIHVFITTSENNTCIIQYFGV